MKLGGFIHSATAKLCFLYCWGDMPRWEGSGGGRWVWQVGLAVELVHTGSPGSLADLRFPSELWAWPCLDGRTTPTCGM